MAYVTATTVPALIFLDLILLLWATMAVDAVAAVREL
jgi:hypothetical protein